MPPAAAAAGSGGKFVPRAQNAALPDGERAREPDGDGGRFAGWTHRETAFGNRGSSSQNYLQQQKEPFWPSQQAGQQQKLRQQQEEEEASGSPALAGEGGADFWSSGRQTSDRFAGLTTAPPKQGVYHAPGSGRARQGSGGEPSGSPGLGGGGDLPAAGPGGRPALLPGWREPRQRDAAAERRPAVGGGAAAAGTDSPTAHPQPRWQQPQQERTPAARSEGSKSSLSSVSCWQPPRAGDGGPQQAPPEPAPAVPEAPDPAAALVFARQWAFWLHLGVDGCVPAHGAAAEGARHLAAAGDASQFWAAYTHLKHPSDVPLGTAYLLLCERLPPLAAQLPGAGRFLLRLRKGDSASCVWEEMLLRCVGEQWEPYDEVIGVAVSVLAEEDVVELWTRNGGWAEALQQLHQQLCSLPPAAAVISVQYEPLAPPQMPLVGMGGGAELSAPHPFHHPAAAYGAHAAHPHQQQHFHQQVGVPGGPAQHPAGDVQQQQHGYVQQQTTYYVAADQQQHWRPRPHGGRMAG